MDRYGTHDTPATPLNAYSGEAKMEKEVEAYESPFRYHFNRNKLPKGAKLGQALTPINPAGSPEANPFDAELVPTAPSASAEPAAPAFDYTESDAREFLQPLATNVHSESPIKPIRRARSARSSAALAAAGRVLSSFILIGVSAVVLFGVAYLSILWAPKLPKIDLGAIPFVAAANPSATPTRTAYPTSPPTPSVTVQPCTLWSDLTPADVGSVKCVYGTIVKIYHTEMMFEIIRFSERAGTFLVWDKKAYFEGIDKGMCVKVEGLIYKDASELYMEIAGSTWGPYTGCP